MDVRRRISFNNDEDTGPIDTNNYLTIVALEDGLTATLGVYFGCECCIDGDGNWINSYYPIPINQGQTLSFRGRLTPNSYGGVGQFRIDKKCNLEGNCMSLLFGDNAANHNSLSGKDGAFMGLFMDCTTIVQVSETFLPATTLAEGCYQNMFLGCTSLTTAPELPATTLASSCYECMFDNCNSLTTAPTVLPATTLAEYCYASMFYDCTSLTNAPKLPATTLAEYCCQNMFYGCTSLTTGPSVLPATTLAECCYYYMFYGCTSLTTAPELPATTLARYCYRSMFEGCSKLNYIKMLATNISASSCLSSWVYGVASTGTFVKKRAMTSLPTGGSGIPRGWTVQSVH